MCLLLRACVCICTSVYVRVCVCVEGGCAQVSILVCKFFAHVCKHACARVYSSVPRVLYSHCVHVYVYTHALCFVFVCCRETRKPARHCSVTLAWRLMSLCHFLSLPPPPSPPPQLPNTAPNTTTFR